MLSSLLLLIVVLLLLWPCFFPIPAPALFCLLFHLVALLLLPNPWPLPHPLAHMFVCVRLWAAFVFSTLSVLRLWSQLRSRHRNRNQKPRNRQTEPWIPLLTPPTGLCGAYKWLLNCIPVIATHLSANYALKVLFFDTHTLRACELSWVKGKIRLLRPLKCVTFWVCSTSNICSNIYQDYVPGLGKRCPGLDTSD